MRFKTEKKMTSGAYLESRLPSARFPAMWIRRAHVEVIDPTPSLGCSSQGGSIVSLCKLRFNKTHLSKMKKCRGDPVTCIEGDGLGQKGRHTVAAAAAAAAAAASHCPRCSPCLKAPGILLFPLPAWTITGTSWIWAQ